MLRGIWQRVKDAVYDSVLSVFRTQTEIDEYIEEDLSDYGTVTYNPTTIPAEASLRPKLFWTPEDLKKYISDGGIPASVCTILALPDFDDEGNTAYRLYVLDNTP